MKNVQDIYRLSPMQQGMLFHTLYSPGDGAYVEQVYWRWRGPLQAQALRGAWRRVVDRHPILRTAFFWEGLPEPMQAVRQKAEAPFEEVDWQGLGEAGQEAAFNALAEQHRQGLSLSAAPLMRFTVARLGPELYQCLWSYHHLLLDAWSVPLCLREVFLYYEALQRGQELELPLPPPYRQFIAWLGRQDREAALRHWRKVLAGFRSPTPLVVERSAGSAPAGAASYGSRSARLGAATSERLTALARQHQLTLGTLVQGAWAVLCSRYSGEQEVAFGAVVSGRPPSLPGVEGMVGLFINNVVIRQQVPPTARLLPWLKQLQEQQMAALSHDYLSLVELQGCSEVPRGQPLFNTMVVVENTPSQQMGPELGGRLPVEGFARIEARTGYPLTLVLHLGSELEVQLVYDERRLEPAPVERMVGHLRTLLEALPDSLQQPLGRLPLLTEAERRQVLVEWNTPRPSPRESTLHGRFEAQAARTPEAVAVSYEGQHLTYRELDRRANQLAWHLRSLGVGPEVLVGLCVERSLDMVLAILAILKAGGAYLPLDPTYPQERLAFMVEDSRLSVLLTQEHLRGRLPASSAQVLCLEAQPSSPQGEGPPGSGAQASHLAYVIYTSGSTGKPKGAQICHEQVIRLFTATEPWYDFGPGDVWTLFHSYAFDFSVWELWGALLYGGRLVVVPYLTSRSPEAFHALLHQERVTVLNQTPSAFRQLIQYEESTASPAPLALRHVIFGGEALEFGGLRPWFNRHGDSRPVLVNMYGITETTVHVTYRALRAEDARGLDGSVVGVPIPDLQCFILGPELQPVPVGVAGELYVGGEGLARGYLHRPQLTAERFTPHPFSSQPGARLYKTGDRARFLANGQIEYLGRLDNQVKVRGFRIELGEIEAVLTQHEGVREAVVLAREDVPGEKRLVAYVTLRSPVEAGELRAWLKGRLPEYMVPAAVVVLPVLPLTSNGKVDRRALPAPEPERPARARVAPASAEEELVAAAFAEVLGLPEVGVEDDFFDLGGDSIRGIKLVSRAARSGVRFSVSQLFEQRTPRALARGLRAGAEAGSPTAPFSLVSEEDRRRLPPEVEDAYPMTSLQLGMLFHGELSPESMPYHNVNHVRLRGALDSEAFRRSLGAVVARHPALRTGFALSGYSEPLQLVYREPPLLLEVVDLRGQPEESQRAVLEGWYSAERRTRFDHARAPLIRFSLHRLAEEVFQLGWTEHHAIVDGWSLHSLLAELFERYLGYLRGTPVEPAPLQVGFRDFLPLERAARESEASRAFFKELLADAPHTPLPRWPGALAQAHSVRQQQVPIPPALSQALKQAARRADVPLKSVLLAAHCRVLAAFTGQEEVVTGLGFNGRPETEDGERAVGLFLNLLPFRLPLGGGTWLELLREAFRRERELMPHRRLPLVDVQRGQGERPFEVLFNYTHFHMLSRLREAAELQVLEHNELNRTSFPLVVEASVDHATSEVKLALCHDPAEVSAAQVEVMAGCYARVLEQLAQGVGERYEAQSLLSQAWRHRLLVEWNHTRSDFPAEATLHELFSQQAQRTPHAVAVTAGEQRLTYAQLEQRANQLAHLLRRNGVGPDVPVALCLERSAELIVCLLAILKAGGAYVPLDVAYPTQRLSFMLEDAQPRLLLTTRALAERLPAASHLPCVCVEEVDFSSLPTSALASNTSARNLAYIIFTSGSTGRPKGVAVEHRAVLRLVLNSNYVRLGPEDCIAQVSNTSFDAATFEVWGALLHGARLALLPREVLLSPPHFVEALRRERVSSLFLTTALFNQVAQQVPGAFSSLREVLFGGEACDPDTIRSVLRQGPPARLLHVYGPTESTTFATWHPVLSVPEGSTTVPIGGPLSNTTAYVLDWRLQPVPPGVPGELYLGGEGLARGYVGRPEATAERFVPHPFSSQPGERLYRTGDKVRWLPGGALEFLGRFDSQVKLRGFRIELGEVEAALRERPGVGEVLVLLREDVPGDKRLVAYVTSRGPQPLEASALREALRQRLPEYMVPSALMVLEALPLTPNGKVDRKALPAPEQQHTAAGTYTPPSTQTEKELAHLFAQVLRVERVGVEEDFFTLGGHSLLATQLVSRVRSELKVELPLRTLFEAPTVRALAVRLEAARQAEGSSPVPPLRQAERTGPLPLSFTQQRLWFVHQLEPTSSAYNIAASLRISGPLHTQALERSLREVQQRHEALRTTFQLQGDEPVQALSPSPLASLQQVDLSGLPEPEQQAELQRHLSEVARSPFALAQGPLLRATLLRLAPEQHVLSLCMHHIISDGWSMSVLVVELTALYEVFSSERLPALSPLPVQYADYAHWQRAWLQGERLERQLSYWKRQLQGAPALLTLPVDKPRPPTQSSAGASLPLSLSAELTASLRTLAQRCNATLFMVLLAAYDVLLGHLSDQREVVVGTPSANRSRGELEPLIGFFVNTLALRVDLRGDPSFTELVGRVREVSLAAAQHQEVPFQAVVDALKLTRNTSYAPVYQAWFVFNTELAPIKLPGLTFTPLPVETQAVRNDLMLGLSEAGSTLRGELSYRTELFEPATLSRWAEQLQALLQAVVEQPEAPLSSLYGRLKQVEQAWYQQRHQALQSTSLSRLQQRRRRPQGAPPTEES